MSTGSFAPHDGILIHARCVIPRHFEISAAGGQPTPLT